MPQWSELAKETKMLVAIYHELEAGRSIWFTRLAEILKNDMTRSDISLLEDRLMDLGILDKQYWKADGMWTSCYRIESEILPLVMDVAKGLRKTFRCPKCDAVMYGPCVRFSVGEEFRTCGWHVMACKCGHEGRLG